MKITKSNPRIAFGLVASVFGAMMVVGTLLGAVFSREPVPWDTIASLGGLGVAFLAIGIAYFYEKATSYEGSSGKP